MPKRQYRCEKLPTCNFFLPNFFLWSKKPNLGKLFLGPFFPDFGAQIGQQHFFIIWQDGQTPH